MIGAAAARALLEALWHGNALPGPVPLLAHGGARRAAE